MDGMSIGLGIGAMMGKPPEPSLLSFITTWDTTGASETVTLPATSASNNFTVDWGDGASVETITAASPSHVYATADTYEITIAGTCPTWSFSDGGDKLKIKDVKQWGEIGLTNLSGGFWGCSNMVVTATDAGGFGAVTTMASMLRTCPLANPDTTLWDVGLVTSMITMFQSSTSANPDVSNWNVTSLTTTLGMFDAATLANPDVSNWNVTSLDTATVMFRSSGFSSANYDLLLAAWSLLTLKSGVAFSAGTAKYTEAAARLVMTDPPNNWVITDGGPA